MRRLLSRQLIELVCGLSDRRNLKCDFYRQIVVSFVDVNGKYFTPLENFAYSS